MKKTYYLLFMFIGLVFTSCEPMEDIHDELDAEIEGKVAGTIDSYTLTEDDYKETLDLSFASFNSVEEAKELVPVVLSDIFPSLGAESSVNVSFDLYDPIRIQEITLTDADYETLNLSDNYIADFGQLQDFLENEFPQADQGSYAELTYNKIAEEISYSLNDSDFELIEESLSGSYPGPAGNAGSYGSFDVRDWSDNYWNDDMILEAINVVLSEEFDDVPGQTYNVSYDVYYPATLSMSVAFDGNEYVRVGGMAYDVSNDDFDLIGAEFATIYPDPSSSAAQYSNFERRTDNDAYWSDAMIMEALDFLMKEKFPDATDGTEYDVTYRIYTGSSGSEIISLVFENGAWVENTNATIYTVVETTVLAFANNSWSMPYSLESEDYTAMGQRYPNFSDEDEAIYKIGIFLGLEFPYAEEGDFAALTYDFYSGGVSAEYANYFFNGEEWEYIPSVVEQSLQFGHDGNDWVPDNTIRYTLTKADFGIISNELIDKYPGPADNAGFFGSFDVRESSDNYWNDDMLLEAFNVFLNQVDPDAEIGQKYVLSYAVYNGATVTLKTSLIKTESGWVINN